MFRNLFKEGLQIQRERVREMRTYAREKQAAAEKVHADDIESLEN